MSKYYCYKCGKLSANETFIFPPQPDDLLCVNHSLEKLLLVKLKERIPEIVSWIVSPKGTYLMIPITETSDGIKHLVVRLEYAKDKQNA
jgi:hypothetical protein